MFLVNICTVKWPHTFCQSQPNNIITSSGISYEIIKGFPFQKKVSFIRNINSAFGFRHLVLFFRCCHCLFIQNITQISKSKEFHFGGSSPPPHTFFAHFSHMFIPHTFHTWFLHMFSHSFPTWFSHTFFAHIFPTCFCTHFSHIFPTCVSHMFFNHIFATCFSHTYFPHINAPSTCNSHMLITPPQPVTPTC